MSAAVDVSGVRKRYDTTIALDDVSLVVERGDMYGVIGPDGAGKTTLLRLVCGLLKPDAGAIHLFGRDPYQDHRAATSAIGYVSQRFSLYGDLSIDENIEFFAALHGVTDFAARRERLLALTGLTPFRTRLGDRLSGGMKQKLALACTLVHEPPLVVLDEPTTGVDPVSRREFWKLLAEFRAEGLTILVATPYLDEAERCGRVALMSEGRVLAVDEPARLQRGVAGLVFEVVAAPARRALDEARRIVGADRVQLFGERLHVTVATEDELRALVTRLTAVDVAVAGSRRIVPSLEDVFIDRITRARADAPVSHIASTP
jgi:ABC-2 type transport system ATP-binding protein